MGEGIEEGGEVELCIQKRAIRDKREGLGRVTRRTLMSQPRIMIVSAWAFSDRHTRSAAAARSASDMDWCSPIYPSISACCAGEFALRRPS